jgi:hypothetical protein
MLLAIPSSWRPCMSLADFQAYEASPLEATRASAIHVTRRLRSELKTWRQDGRQAVLWWRDDDAVGVGRPLTRLLRLADRYSVPLTLAVIPTGDCRAVAAQVRARPQLRLAQHGVDHRNRREAGHTGEFPLEWSRHKLAAHIADGWTKLEALPEAMQVFVPPWNNVHPELPDVLAAAGYIGWSAAGTTGEAPGPPRFDADLDIIDWAGGAHFKGAWRILDELTGALARRRHDGEWARPVGLLSHHLDHDFRAWLFLDAFIRWTRGEPAFIWKSLESLALSAMRARSVVDIGGGGAREHEPGLAPRPENWR